MIFALYIPLTLDDVISILDEKEMAAIIEIYNEIGETSNYLETIRRIIKFDIDDQVSEFPGYNILPVFFSKRIFYLQNTFEFCIPLLPDSFGAIDSDKLIEFATYARSIDQDVKIYASSNN